MEVVNSFTLAPLPTEFIVKIFLLLFLGFYFVFAVLLIRQVHLMVSAIKIPLESLFNFLAYLNLVLTVFLIVVAIIFL